MLMETQNNINSVNDCYYISMQNLQQY